MKTRRELSSDLSYNKNNFILNCNDIKKANLPYYNGLKDRNLESYFKNKNIQKIMQSNGIVFTHIFSL